VQGKQSGIRCTEYKIQLPSIISIGSREKNRINIEKFGTPGKHMRSDGGRYNIRHQDGQVP
jgi:hypothetical protein